MEESHVAAAAEIWGLGDPGIAMINLVATCTKRKRQAARTDLQLRSLAHLPPGEAAEIWVERLCRSDHIVTPAIDLYAGDHWSVIRSCIDQRAGEVQGWALSAGYGLIPVAAKLQPYSATFSRNHPDGVARGQIGDEYRTGLRSWWERLSTWAGPVPGAPRTFAALAAGAPSTPLLVVASESYLDTVAPDLRRAAEVLERPDLLTIVSAGTAHLSGLEENLLRFGAKLQQRLGGGLHSLNARVVREAVRRGAQMTTSGLQDMVNELGHHLPETKRTRRQSLSDDAVAKFIRNQLRVRPSAAHTTLLNQLRREFGLACEQTRFKRVFQEVSATLQEN